MPWNKEAAETLLERIREAGCSPMRLMEVCGSHTMAIAKSGIKSLLPENISLLSGPGCPHRTEKRKVNQWSGASIELKAAKQSSSQEDPAAK